MKKEILLTSAFMFSSMLLFAQSPDLASPAREFFETTLRPLYPIVVAAVGLVGGLMNIGKVMGTDSDWKGFFRMIGLFLAGAIVLVAMVEFLFTLTVN